MGNNLKAPPPAKSVKKGKPVSRLRLKRTPLTLTVLGSENPDPAKNNASKKRISGSVIFADIGDKEIHFFAHEHLPAGQRVQIQLDQFPDFNFKGFITLSHKLEKTSRILSSKPAEVHLIAEFELRSPEEITQFKATLDRLKKPFT